MTLENPATRLIPRTFIHCVESLLIDEIAAEEKNYTNLGWHYRFIPTGHDAMITAPEELTKILLDLI
jgi:hypothetical protein